MELRPYNDPGYQVQGESDRYRQSYRLTDVERRAMNQMAAMAKKAGKDVYKYVSELPDYGGVEQHPMMAGNRGQYDIFTPKNSKRSIAPPPRDDSTKVSKYTGNFNKGVGGYNMAMRRSRRGRRGGLKRKSFRRKSFKRSGGKAVTFQHDVVRMGGSKSNRSVRRSRRNWKKAQYQVSRTLPSNTVFRQFAGEFAATAGTQSIGFVPGMFSLYGTSGSWDDLQGIYNQFGRVAQTATIGGATQGVADLMSNSRFIYKYCRQELDITNTGSTACIVEIFDCVSRDSNGLPSAKPDDDVDVQTFRTAAGVQTTKTSQYFSPYKSFEFARKWKILSCKKVYLKAGDSTDMSNSSSGGIYSPSAVEALTANTKCNWYKKTRFWLIIGTGSPEANAGSPRFSASSLSVMSERQYGFKVLTGGQAISQQQ